MKEQHAATAAILDIELLLFGRASASLGSSECPPTSPSPRFGASPS